MSYEFITVEQKGRIGVITLNRPKQLNALSPGLMKELVQALDVAGVVLGAEPAQHVSIDFIRNGRRSTVEPRLAPLPPRPAP